MVLVYLAPKTLFLPIYIEVSRSFSRRKLNLYWDGEPGRNLPKPTSGQGVSASQLRTAGYTSLRIDGFFVENAYVIQSLAKSANPSKTRNECCASKKCGQNISPEKSPQTPAGQNKWVLPIFPILFGLFSITFAFVYVSMGFFYICFQFLFLPRFWESSKNRVMPPKNKKNSKSSPKKIRPQWKKTTTIRLFPDQTSAPNWKENVAICADGRLKFTQLGVF